MWPWLGNALSLRINSLLTWRLTPSAARSRRWCRRGRLRRRRCGRLRLLARGSRPSRRDWPFPAGPTSPRAQGRKGHPLLLCRPPEARQRRVTLYCPWPGWQRARPPPAPCEVSTRRAARPAARGLELSGAAALASAVPQWHGGAGGGEGQGRVRPREPLPGFPGAGEGQGSAARTPGPSQRTRDATQPRSWGQPPHGWPQHPQAPGQGAGHGQGRAPQDPIRTVFQYMRQWAAPKGPLGRPAGRPSASLAAGAPARGGTTGGGPAGGAPPAGLAPSQLVTQGPSRDPRHRLREASWTCCNSDSWGSSIVRTGWATPTATAGRKR